jgi:hypothetical protein
VDAGIFIPIPDSYSELIRETPEATRRENQGGVIYPCDTFSVDGV